jgi:DNA-nicking Smr family endonuclease
MIRNPNERRPRRLSADEHTLWKTATHAVKPLKPIAQDDGASAAAPPAPEASREQSKEMPAVPVARAGKKAGPPPLAPLERRLRQRLAKDDALIERRLDLHGLTQREAHDALVHFLRTAQAQDVKIVLVVTGKGGRGAERDPFSERGVLRRLVPHWLNAPEFRRLVLGFEAAHVGHGGEGALYVRLRRPRVI